MSLDPFFTPSTIAVIGASRDPDKVGHEIMSNLTERYSGTVHPVNPNAETVLDMKSYDGVSEIDEQVDHAVIAIPASVANNAVQDCINNDVPAITVVTSGYQEIGGEGKERQEKLKTILEDTDSRLIGPNCLGIWDAASGVDTMFLSHQKLGRPPEGSIALISQSGSVGSSLLDLAAEAEIGISRFISYGNQADVEERELLEWLENDDKTDAIAVYMEGAKSGRPFYEALDHVASKKPVVILKAGKSTNGSAAASSHTGSLAGSYSVYNGAFKQSGAIEALNAEQLFDKAKELAYEPLGHGKNVAVVTNGGGYGVLAADAVADSDLELASFTDTTTEKLRELIPDYGNINNPLDVLGDATPETFAAALSILEDDPNVDLLLPIPLLQPAPMSDKIVEVLKEHDDARTKPMAVCMVGGTYTTEHVRELENRHVPVFPTPVRATEALNALYRYGEQK